MVKFVLHFCYCAVDQERPFLKGNGPFLAHLPFWTRGLPTTAGSPHHSGSSPPQRGLPTTAGSPHHSGYCAVDQERQFFKGNGPFLAHLPFWTRGLPTTAGSPHRSGSSRPQRGLHSGVSPPHSGVPSSSFSMKGRKSVPTRAFLPLKWGGP